MLGMFPAQIAHTSQGHNTTLRWGPLVAGYSLLIWRQTITYIVLKQLQKDANALALKRVSVLRYSLSVSLVHFGYACSCQT